MDAKCTHFCVQMSISDRVCTACNASCKVYNAGHTHRYNKHLTVEPCHLLSAEHSDYAKTAIHTCPSVV